MSGLPPVQKLAGWFGSNALRLRTLPPDAAADEIGDRVLSLDERLGVEVSDDSDARELVVTGFSNPLLAPLVKQLVSAIGTVHGWRIVALKPAGGFDFEMALGESEVRAQGLSFVPHPGTFGVDLVVPAEVLAGLEDEAHGSELAWLIVEAGIGEELASALEHVGLTATTHVDARPIVELHAYVAEQVSTR